MFNKRKSANYVAHGSRNLLPVFKLSKLHPKQRRRLEKSSRKVGDLLGEMPIIDIVPSSPLADGAPIVRKVVVEKRGRKGAKANAPSAPVLHYKLAPVDSPRQSASGPESGLQVPGARSRKGKAIPNTLDLASPVWRAQARPRSPLWYNRTGSPGFLSPMSPFSPFSPIETSDMREERYHGLRRLARVSRLFRETIVDELPSIAQIAQQVNVNTYLDLYRITTQEKRLTRDSDAYTAYSACTDIQSAYTACSLESRRHSSAFRRSVHTLRSATPIARTSFIVPQSGPHSAAACSEADRPVRYTLAIEIPSPRAPNFEPQSAISGGSSALSYTLVLNVPAKPSGAAPETPADEESPLQHQQREARARAAILSAMRPLAISADLGLLQPDVSPTTPLPTALAKMRTVPYWVRSAYRVSAHGYVRRTHSYARRSGVRVPTTPGTMRRERRQGWGGEWKQGKMASVVEGLKEIKTPAPVAAE